MRLRFAITIIFLLCTVSPTALASAPVHITGSSGLSWVTGEDTLIVQGEVQVTYEDVLIYCDRLVVDTKDQIMEAFGNVTYEEDGDTLDAAYLRYDLDSRESYLSLVRAVFKDDANVNGPLYLSGQEVKSSPDEILLYTSTLTGCELTEPHYHLEARQIQYYPDDKIIARGVSYYEGRYKLFTLPYLVVSLKKSRWEAPKIGYNSEDGWYLKTTYNYYRNPDWLGSIFLDYYQLKGWGTGFKHQYNLHSILPATGWLYFYTKGNGDQDQPNSYHTALSYQPELPDPWKGELQGEYKTTYLQETLWHEWGANAKLSWHQGSQRFSSRYNLLNKNPNQLWTGSVYQSVRGSFSYEDRPRDDLRYALATSLTSQQRVGLAKQDPSRFAQVWVSQYLDDYTLDFRVEHQKNPVVGNDEDQPDWESYTLLPEVKLTTKRLSWGQRTLPLRASVSASRIQEEPGNLSTMKATGQLTLTGLNYQLGRRDTLNITGGLAGSYYDTNNAQLQANTRSSYNHRFTSQFKSTLNHTWTGRLGVSPLAYDLAQPTHNLRGILEYTAASWRAALSGGFDFIEAIPEDIVADYSYRHSRSFNTAMQLAYALPEDYLEYAKVSAAYTPDKEHSVKTSIYYDFPEKIWRDVEVELGYRLNSLWFGSARLDWDGLYGGRLKQGQVSLTRDLHCRELRLSVDAVQEEVWVELIFKLFPSEPLRLGATEDQLMVDLDFLKGEL